MSAWMKFNVPVPPSPVPLSLTGAGALGINLSCALMLARHRHHGGSLMRAAFLSARNDVLANVAIIGAGLVTVFCPSAWPDLIVGLGIAILNGDAARQGVASRARGTPFSACLILATARIRLRHRVNLQIAVVACRGSLVLNTPKPTAVVRRVAL